MTKERITWLAGILLVPVIIFLYFFKWKSNVIYGDDLYIYFGINRATTLSDKLHYLMSANKFRPIQAFLIYFSDILFKKNLLYFYGFNVLVQAINTLLLAKIISIFTKSTAQSIFFALIYGLSRFTVYNLTQLYNGGALEGVALAFFLLSVYYITVIFYSIEPTLKSARNNFLAAILFANLAVYTHERYIVLLPFLVFALFTLPAFKRIQTNDKLLISGVALGSILFNVLLKKFVFDMPFLVGTGGTNITFSFLNIVYFLRDGVFSILLINSQPDYLTGLPFTSLPFMYKLVCIFMSISTILLLVAGALKSLSKNKSVIYFYLFGAMLFFVALMPAIITIRLEQRWLQASLCVLVILIASAFEQFKQNSVVVKTSLLTIFVAFFIFSDHYYLKNGAPSLYLNTAHRLSTFFYNGVQEKAIQSTTKKLIFVMQKRNENSENELMWSIGNGDVFEYYHSERKQIYFTDSVYNKMKSAADTNLTHFNASTEQLITITDRLIDLSGDFKRDSLKNFR